MTEEQGKRHQTLAGLLSHKLTNRKRALLNQFFDALEQEAKRPGGRDPARALVDAFYQDPQGFLSWLNSLLPKEQPAQPGLTLGINHLHLQAVQALNRQELVDVTPAGVQSGSVDW